MFELGQNYTRQEIHDQLGGDLQSYLPIANGRAVCACLNRDKNPEAPNVVVVGTGPGIENAGELLAMQVGSIPVFLKQESNAWTFQGSFEVARSTQDPAELAPYKTANGSEITRLIYLKPSGDQVATSAVEPDTRNRHGRSRRRREHLLDGLERSHIVQGIKLFNAGHAHGFADSTKFDLLFEGRHYPPKAVVGLASIPLHGFALVPDDFTGGAGSKCFRILQRNGFDVVPKPSEFAPTAETLLLEVRTKEALQAPSIPRPTGQVKPGKVNRETVAYERDPLVIAFVLRRAAGKCECCGEDAPFRNVWGMPFLEVHHIRSLSVGGADTVENTAALCPNCHRECHYGENASALQQRLTTMAELSSGEQLR